MSWFPEPLHPALVHFPIALTFAALLFEVLGLVPKLRQLGAAVPVLLLLAALGAVGAVVSGNAAEEEAVVPAAAKALVEQHEELGEKVMVGLLVLAALRLFLFRAERYATWVRLLLLGLLLLVSFAVGYNGKLGGELVFRHGVGTASSLQAPTSGPAPGEGHGER
jgi:uncharacterized membrane protein